MSRDDLERFIEDQLARHKVSTAALRFRNLRRLYNWMVTEEIIPASPLARLSEPVVPEDPVDIITDAELQALFKVVGGKGFIQRRDHAIMTILLDTGIRRDELVGLSIDDVDLDVNDALKVVGKGGRERSVPFGDNADTALERYLRERAKHPKAKTTAFRRRHNTD